MWHVRACCRPTAWCRESFASTIAAGRLVHLGAAHANLLVLMTTQPAIIVTGSNRGLGLEMVKQLLTRGDRVVATTRDGSANADLRALTAACGARLTVEACDVSDPASIAAFAVRVHAVPLCGLINNAGVWGQSQHLEALDFVETQRMYQINALAPLQLVIALRPQLARQRAKVAHITSAMASIAETSTGGQYGYRMSKAALNMMNRTLAIDLAADGIYTAVIEPGWAKTDMGGPNAPTEVADSVRGVLAQYDAIGPATTGQFLSYRGGTMAW